MYGAAGVNASLAHDPLHPNIIARLERRHCNNALLIGPNQQQRPRSSFYGVGMPETSIATPSA
jgi:hypothetical protein